MDKEVLLKKLTWRILALLIVEYLLGMALNLWVKIPDYHPGTNASEYFSGAINAIAWASSSGIILLAAHVIVALGLVVFSLVLLIVAITSHKKAWIVSTSLGSLFILSAMFNGASFINYNHDFSSYIMAVSFLIAFISYGLGIHAATKPAPST